MAGLFIAIFTLITMAQAEDELQWEPSISVWLAHENQKLVNTPSNPQNLFAKAPNRFDEAQVRAQLKVIHSIGRVTARPKFSVLISSSDVAGAENRSHSSKLTWTEAFATAEISHTVGITYGLQNFQWGPAESFSPSNRIFRDTIQSKDLLYETKGKHLVRINFTPSQNWSEILLIEPSGNGDPELEAQENFAPKALLKSEFSWAGGIDYLGLVIGHRLHFGNWLGEYANLEILSGLSVYADASHQQGTLAYYPGTDPTGKYTLLAQTNRNSIVYHSLVTGIRYNFENGNDFRLEWIYQSSGYSTQQTDLLWNALTSTQFGQMSYLGTNLLRTKQNGLEFPGREYAYLSFRFPDVCKIRDWTLYVRNLFSLQDHSSAFYISSENAIGDHGTIMGSLGATKGEPKSELRGIIAMVAQIGGRISW